MPETLDFDQIARRLQAEPSRQRVDESAATVHAGDRHRRAIVEELRLIWNARGAADIDAVTGIYGVQGATLADVIRPLRRLDR